MPIIAAIIHYSRLFIMLISTYSWTSEPPHWVSSNEPRYIYIYIYIYCAKIRKKISHFLSEKFQIFKWTMFSQLLLLHEMQQNELKEAPVGRMLKVRITFEAEGYGARGSWRIKRMKDMVFHVAKDMVPLFDFSRKDAELTWFSNIVIFGWRYKNIPYQRRYFKMSYVISLGVTQSLRKVFFFFFFCFGEGSRVCFVL